MMRTRRAAGVLMAAGMIAAAQSPGSRPNFIVILADDLGYGDLSSYGSQRMRTPRIDSLAREGVRFTSAYVTAALCSPSRAGLMTGRYQQRFGHEFNPRNLDGAPEIGLPLDQITMAQRLRTLGYRTGAIGKWHLGSSPAHHPLERGFDEFFGFLRGANSYFLPTTPGRGLLQPTPVAAAAPLEKPGARAQIFRNRDTVEENEYLTDAFGREAASFIERHKTSPFFLYVAFNAVHTPLQSMERHWDRFPEIANPRHRMLAAMASAMDDAVGLILAKLAERGLEKNTLVVFLSDNGSPAHFGAGSNAPLGGEKVTYYEGGIRVPFLIRFPGRVKAGQEYDQPVSSLDVLPTLLAAAGSARPAELDGVDLMPHLKGDRQQPPHETLYWRAGYQTAARRGPWKLLQIDGKARLFHLGSDLAERKDVAAQHPDVTKALVEAVARWNSGLVKPLWAPARIPIPVHGEPLRWDGEP
ncbi:MAG: sulfatase-like hydrolase/transferase [Bryobacteraceae bacterium]|nr:sulfatase-like hydrolase/transferase [Bryobacteraceae bacterium]